MALSELERTPGGCNFQFVRAIFSDRLIIEGGRPGGTPLCRGANRAPPLGTAALSALLLRLDTIFMIRLAVTIRRSAVLAWKPDCSSLWRICFRTITNPPLAELPLPSRSSTLAPSWTRLVAVTVPAGSEYRDWCEYVTWMPLNVRVRLGVNDTGSVSHSALASATEVSPMPSNIALKLLWGKSCQFDGKIL